MNRNYSDRVLLQKIIAENLVFYLAKKDMTHKMFSKKMSINLNVINGRAELSRELTLDDLLNISGLLGVGIHDLLKDGGSPEEGDLSKKIMKLVGRLDMGKKKSFYGILKIL